MSESNLYQKGYQVPPRLPTETNQQKKRIILVKNADVESENNTNTIKA